MGRKNHKRESPPSDGSLPAAFLDRISAIVPTEKKSQVLSSFEEEKKTSFRINSLIQSEPDKCVSELEDQGIKTNQIAWFDLGYTVEPEFREPLLASEAFENSQIYVQNPSSYLPCLILGPCPGEQVLDLAAAPGGKSLLLAALMKNDGLLSTVEPIRGRFFKLQTNLKRYGCTIARTYMSDGRAVGKKVPERFDRVLIDAPCSGESRIHRSNPESFQFWSERKIKEQSRKQYGLIRSGFEALRPGGKLVYCTCSFAPEENEKIVSDFLSDHDNACLSSISVPSSIDFQSGIAEWNGTVMHPEIDKTVRILPDATMDGFFVASLSKIQ